MKGDGAYLLRSTGKAECTGVDTLSLIRGCLIYLGDNWGLLCESVLTDSGGLPRDFDASAEIEPITEKSHDRALYVNKKRDPSEPRYLKGDFKFISQRRRRSIEITPAISSVPAPLKLGI